MAFVSLTSVVPGEVRVVVNMLVEMVRYSSHLLVGGTEESKMQTKFRISSSGVDEEM